MNKIYSLRTCFAMIVILLTSLTSLTSLTACGGGDEPHVNQPPAVQIASPFDLSTFRAGDILAFGGTAIDPEDGTLSPKGLVWWVDLHRDTQSQSLQPQTSGGSGTVTVPTRGGTSANIFLRFHLRATDSLGATHEVTRDVLPRTAKFTLATEPAGAGLALTLDGQPAPALFTSVVGMERTLGTATEQIINNRRYQFSGWSDGGAVTHDIVTSDADTTYTAVFTDLGPLVNTAQITNPADGSTFRGGDTLEFAAIVTDPASSALPSADLVWWVDLHHDNHSHPFQPQTSGRSGTVRVPTRGETSANIFLRFHLRATDSLGATHEVTRDVLPRTAKFTLATEPAGAGLALTLDGQPAPALFTSVVGMERTLGTATEQIINNRRYQFSGWSDGGAVTHDIVTSDADTTYTAVFTDLGPLVNPPVVALTAPAGASSGTIGVAITVSAAASDTDGRIAGVEFFENDVKIGSTVTSAPYSVTWTPAIEGTRVLKARATDNAGLATTAESTVNVRALVRIVAPAKFANGLTGPLTITADAADNAGVAKIEIQVDGQTVGGGIGSGTSHSVSVDTNNYASGQHILRARVTDATGKQSAWVKATVSFGGERTQPAGFVREENWIVGGLGSEATALAQTPDGRLLVAEKWGALRVIKNGVLLPEPMLTVANVDGRGERGLIGIAVDPNFTTSGWIYVHHTTTEDGPIPGEPSSHNRITRYTATGDTAGTPTVLVDLSPLLPESTIHNGGGMHFGADGKLYVGVGDNRSPESPNLASVFGKMLRFNSDGSIPPDNPYYSSQAGLARAIWARGLRNPFTFAVQPGTGRIHINDVGEERWEEVNLGAPAANYGWPSTEGPTGAAGITAPLFAYAHGATFPLGSGTGGFFQGCAISGAAFYPGTGTFPAAYRDSYYFIDHCSGFIARIDLANGNDAYAFGKVSVGNPTGLLVGQDGSLYVLMLRGIARFKAL